MLVVLMTLDRRDKEFRHQGVSYLDYKQVEMDRVLTALLPRLWWDGRRSVLARSSDLTVDDFVTTIGEHPAAFANFDPAITHRWLETHLLDVVNRGKATQAVACAPCTASPIGSAMPGDLDRTGRTSNSTRCSRTRPGNPAR